MNNKERELFRRLIEVVLWIVKKLCFHYGDNPVFDEINDIKEEFQIEELKEKSGG